MIASSRSRVLLVDEQPCRAAKRPRRTRRWKTAAKHIGAGDTGHDGVRKRVAHQRPALQHQIGGEECADAADERGDPHGLEHVLVGEGFEQLGDHLPRSLLSDVDSSLAGLPSP